jgi:hypothetical protein
MAAVGFAALTFLWLSFGVHLPASIVLADGCAAVNTFVNNRTFDNSTFELPSGLNSFLECLTNDSYSPALGLSTDGITQAVDQVNSYTVPCCGIYFTEENITSLNVPCTIHTIS